MVMMIASGIQMIKSDIAMATPFKRSAKFIFSSCT